MLVDNHLHYPAALLQVFSEVLHLRRKRRHGRRKSPALKPPLLLAGVVHQVRDASGNEVKVRCLALFGRGNTNERGWSDRTRSTPFRWRMHGVKLGGIRNGRRAPGPETFDPEIGNHGQAQEFAP
jgi:hypothetical protein